MISVSTQTSSIEIMHDKFTQQNLYQSNIEVYRPIL